MRFCVKVMVKVWALKGLLLLLETLEMERQSRMINWCPTPLSFLFLSENLFVVVVVVVDFLLSFYLLLLASSTVERRSRKIARCVESKVRLGRSLKKSVESYFGFFLVELKPDSGLSTHAKVHPVLSHLRHNP